MVTLILTVPTFLAVTLPVEVTDAIPVFKDLNVYFVVSLAPPALTVVIFPTQMLEEPAFSVRFWAAFVIENLLRVTPSNLPFPVMVTVAFPAFILLL